MVDFTVAIPTYNGEKRLPDVLERLKGQVGTTSLSWEVIVVDNNSTDGTQALVESYQQGWDADWTLRYVREHKQGAAHARQRAVEEAKGEFVGFLDDDNLPASDWVISAYQFGQAHPKAGGFGSQIYGDFEVAPPDNFKSIACYLAIIQRGSKPHRYEPRTKMLPPGAGLVVRRRVWLNTVPKQLVLNNTGKAAGLASEDLEAILHIQKAGWEIWYNPQMQVHHKIPSWRLEKEYLISLFRCVGLSRHRIRMLSVKTWQRPIAFLAYMANDLRKLVLHVIRYRKVINSDLIAACQTELLLSSLVSPFFLMRKRCFSPKKV